METYKIIDQLNLESESLENSTPQQMLAIAKESYELALSVGYHNGIAKSLFLQGRAHLRLGNMQDSENLLLNALEKNKADLDLESEIFNALGNVYVYLEIFDKAYDYYQRSLNLAIKINNRIVETGIFNNIGEIFRRLGDFKSALSYYQKALETPNDSTDLKLSALPLFNLCETYLELDDLSNAENYAYKALDVAKKYNDKLIESASISRLGLIERKRKNYDKAFSYLNDSLFIYEETKERFHIAEIYIELSKIYMDIKNYEKAIEFLIKSSDLADKMSAKSLQCIIYQLMSEANKAIGNIDLTLHYSYKALETRRAMDEEDRQQKLRNIIFRKEAALTEKEKESYRILNAELEHQTKNLRDAYSTLKAVSDIGKQLTATLDLPTIYRSVNHHVKSLMPCDVFGVALYNEVGNSIEYQYLVEDDTSLESSTIPLNQKSSFAVYCFKNSESFIVNTMNEDTSQYTDGRSSSFGNAMPAFMFHPLILRGNTIGVLTVQSKKENVYNDNTLTVLGTVASYLSIAISNAKNAENMQSLNRELSLLSKKDGLTGIFNKRYFNETISNLWYYAMRNQEPLSILMVDIDCFKEYNDLYGHLAGDKVLKTISVILEKNVKRSSDIVARFGGDEFIILLSNTDSNGAVQVADTIVAAINDGQIIHEGSPISGYLTLSIGCATMIPQADSSPSQLIEKSDLCLLMAKKSGRNGVHATNDSIVINHSSSD